MTKADALLLLTVLHRVIRGSEMADAVEVAMEAIRELELREDDLK